MNPFWEVLLRQDPLADVFGFKTTGDRKTTGSDNADRIYPRVSGHRQIKSWLKQVMPTPTYLLCETDSAIPAQIIKRFKAQANQTPIHQPKPFGHARP